MTKNKYLSLLGLAHRARKCVIGEAKIINQIQKGHAKLLLLANDIGKATAKKLSDKSKFYHVPLRIIDDRVTLGKALGVEHRVAICITDSGFAKKIIELIDE